MVSDNDMRRRHAAGSRGQRNTDEFVRRLSMVIGLLVVALVALSVYLLLGLRQQNAWW